MYGKLLKCRESDTIKYVEDEANCAVTVMRVTGKEIERAAEVLGSLQSYSFPFFITIRDMKMENEKLCVRVTSCDECVGEHGSL